MKKLLILFFLYNLTLYSTISDAWRKFFKISYAAKEQVQQQVIQNTALQPRILTLYVLPDIDFKETMLNLYKAGKDQDVHGIIVIINNYGGDASIFSALHDLIKRIRVEKPIISFVVGCAFSGAYLVASASDYIITATVSEVGSIGAIHEIHKYKNSKFKDKVLADLHVEMLRAGTYKALTNPFHDLNEQERNYLQAELQKSYQLFIRIVANNRNLDVNQHALWADGKTFLAHEALGLHLIDKIGTMYDAEEKIIQLLQERYPEKAINGPMIPIFYNASK